jgi:hypothetical protein
MPQHVSLDEARSLLGRSVLGPEEVGRAFGSIDDGVASLSIPYHREQIEAAVRRNQMLVLRAAKTADGTDLTIANMIERFPQAFDQALLRKAGYQLKADWGIELEPLAQTETCRDAWSLVSREILPETRNLAYDEQTSCLRRHAESVGAPPQAVRRRTAAEAIYDTLVAFTATEERLLEKSWDWSASKTVDGGYLNVGGFGSKGMQILSFSAAVRHGALGICATYEPVG